jgi:hypothetical protein
MESYLSEYLYIKAHDKSLKVWRINFLKVLVKIMIRFV